jgi:hypothetical protein
VTSGSVTYACRHHRRANVLGTVRFVGSALGACSRRRGSGVLRDWRWRASREVCWSGEPWVSGSTGLLVLTGFVRELADPRPALVRAAVPVPRLVVALSATDAARRTVRAAPRHSATGVRASGSRSVRGRPGDVRPWPFPTLAPRAAMRDAGRSTIEAPGRAGAGRLHK